MMRSEDSGCVVPWSVAMVLVYDGIIFIKINTHS